MHPETVVVVPEGVALVDYLLPGTLEQGLAFEVSQFGLVANTTDWREGTQAFLEKREPKFQNR